MTRPYSQDLRTLVVSAVEAGSSCCGAARRFGVAVSTVEKWVHRWRETGHVRPLPMGGDHRSRLTGERDWLLARIGSAPDLTLEEIRAELSERGIRVGYGTVWRFFDAQGISFKKNSARGRAGSGGRGDAACDVAQDTGQA